MQIIQEGNMKKDLYDVVDIKEVKKDNNKSNYPKHLLGESAKEAQETFEEFKGMINNMVRSYSKATGVHREDLFNECIFALAKAKRDYDKSKGNSLKTYAKYSMVDAICDYIRKNVSQVNIPSYINKAHRLINRIKFITKNREDWLDFILNNEIKNDELNNCINSLKNMSIRCGISCKDLVERSEFMPTHLNECDVDSIESDRSNVITKILVNDILSNLSDEEKLISKMIMEDMNYTEMARKLNKSDSYIRTKVNSIRDKAIKIIKKDIVNEFD